MFVMSSTKISVITLKILSLLHLSILHFELLRKCVSDLFMLHAVSLNLSSHIFHLLVCLCLILNNFFRYNFQLTNSLQPFLMCC